jgi:hypothetical protein
VPRLTVLAGIELGAEIYVTTVAPDDAAQQLRLAGSETVGARRAPGG